MTKQDFNKELVEIRINHSDWRPFLYPGYPLDAQGMIIGLNPATPGLSAWLSHWDSDNGLDLDAIEKESLNHRQGKSSETRIRLNWLRDGLGKNVRCIETNLYPIASDNIDSMPTVGKDTKHLDLLLKACTVSLLYVHGDAPCYYIANKYGIALPQRKGGQCIGPYPLPGRETVAYFSKQAAYGPSRENMKGIGEEIRRRYIKQM